VVEERAPRCDARERLADATCPQNQYPHGGRVLHEWSRLSRPT
jgi:hypothetical protein